MDVVVEQGAFSDESGWVARILPPRPINPVLVAILLEADPAGTLSISGTDNDTSSKTTLPATVTAPGRAAVPGRLLADIARLLPAKPVRLRINGNRLNVTCGRVDFKLPLIPLEEYPTLPEVPEPVGTVAGDLFSEAVSRVAFAAAKDDAVPVLASVSTILGNDAITMIATDRYRLAMNVLPWTQKKEIEEPILLRAKTMIELSRNPLSAPIEISLDDGKALVGLTSADRRSTFPVIDGTYPNVERLIPANHETVAKVNVLDLSEAVSRVKIVTDKPTVPVRLKFGNDEVFLQAGSDLDAGANEPVECVLEGPVMEIAFNPVYLLEALSAIRDEVVHINMTVPQRPALLTSPSDPAYKHLLMPVRVND